MLLEAEIEGGLGVGRGHEIPARATIADVVQRGELAGDMIRIIKGRRCGGDQAETFCQDRQSRQKR